MKTKDWGLSSPIPEKPLEIKRILTIVLFILVIVSSGRFTGFSIESLIKNSGEAKDIIGKMFFPPDFSYAKRLMDPMIETVQISLVGTILGAIASIPFAVLSARNFIKTKWINGFFRNLLNLFRTIPALVFAALFASVFGFGSFAGMLALFVFTIGLVAKLSYEAIEGIDPGPVEALTAAGAGNISILRYAIIPQVLPQYMSFVLYSFEINIRASAVLGYVGAGGIAEYYDRTLSFLKYDRAGMIVLLSFVVILAIDLVSSYIRERLV